MTNKKFTHTFHPIDGKAIAEDILLKIRKKIVESGITPGLAVIMIGNDEPSKLYVRNKKKACLKVGIDFHTYFCEKETENQIIEMITFLNNDPAVSGIIVQLPLPERFNTQKIIDAIDPKKDADGFHPKNLKNILAGKSTTYPPLVQTVLRILNNEKINMSKKTVALLSHSQVFCPIMVKALENNGAQTKIIELQDAKALKEADIVIVALGKPGCLTGDMIKKDAVVIDIGITKTNMGFTGDADFKSISKIASMATPTPGGVGPVTVAMLLQSTLDLTENSSPS
ncbi:MAG: Bifunctional protein FolD [Parcubacteria group bacterium GW2011_GWA2_38_13]|nr:MAG: Bifunctional protein FolD [Parcubacteria group bacterium GW2011_GWA2_38_13]